MATDAAAVPQGMVRAAFDAAQSRPFKGDLMPHTLAGAMDWLREHPTELALLLGEGWMVMVPGPAALPVSQS